MQIKSEQDYQNQYQKSINHPELFWKDIALQYQWSQNWDKVLDWNFDDPNIQWFVNGKLNIVENCIDRHLAKHADKTAIIWEPNDHIDKTKSITYLELYHQVCTMANVLKKYGIAKGDRVCIYMPMIPELAIAVLACARIGAIHNVVFAGFSATSLADRINDSTCKMIITSDALKRGDKIVNLKTIVDEAIENCKSIEHVLLINHVNSNLKLNQIDINYNEEKLKVAHTCSAEQMDAEDPLFILYTSGSTGKPKGVVHTCGGYMVYVGYSFKQVFNYNSDDIFWCTADIGWITGHSYLLYGPLLNNATTIMFEGIPTYPHVGRFWEIIEKHKVNIFYTAPTAIRSLMIYGTEPIKPFNLNSLKVIGSVGEPINIEAWNWYHLHIGQSKCDLVDTWWQTETGGIMISAIAGATTSKPTFAGRPLPGVQAVLLDQNGNEIHEYNIEGYLCIKFPWPSMIRSTWNNHQRCRDNYFSHYKGYYFTGDGAKKTEDGEYRIIGRVDDVINVSGHRFGTAEIENAINQCEYITESAVVAYPHHIKGQGIYAFVIANVSLNDDEIKLKINQEVEQYIGKIAKPDKIQIVNGLPKTRSGKIMRRILRKIAEGEIENLGDISTLLDPLLVNQLIEGKVH